MKKPPPKPKPGDPITAKFFAELIDYIYDFAPQVSAPITLNSGRIGFGGRVQYSTVARVESGDTISAGDLRSGVLGYGNVTLCSRDDTALDDTNGQVVKAYNSHGAIDGPLYVELRWSDNDWFIVWPRSAMYAQATSDISAASGATLGTGTATLCSRVGSALTADGASIDVLNAGGLVANGTYLSVQEVDGDWSTSVGPC